MGPRLTVSVQTVARSTVGAAGFSRESPQVISGTAQSTTPMYKERRKIRFLLAFFLGTSMNVLFVDAG
ncbi:MAG: hypothetical protein WKF37_13955 [Bryobacteraceae bacterium]